MAEFKLMKKNNINIKDHFDNVQRSTRTGNVNTGQTITPNVYTLNQKPKDNFKKIKASKTLYNGRFNNGSNYT